MGNRLRYDLFISYSRSRDARLANVLRTRIETYGAKLLEARRLKVFQDITSLPMSHDLWTGLQAHLLESRKLLVLLSPKAARSEWVRKEVETFVTHFGVDRLGLALTAGKTRLDERLHLDRQNDPRLKPILRRVRLMKCALRQVSINPLKLQSTSVRLTPWFARLPIAFRS